MGEADSKEKRLQLVFCCSTRDKTETLGLEDREKGEGLRAVHLVF